jgi:DNA invertase Pin-like site-specific DNA recombinase
MLIGYARVSTNEQNLDLQRDALRKAGVTPKNIFTDEVIEEFWRPYYQRFRGGVCEINQHAAS